MILAIDAGNSLLKLGLFYNDKLKENAAINYDDDNFENQLKHWLSKDIKKIGLISVGSQKIIKRITELAPCDVTFIDYKFKSPIHNKYLSPETLGIDRITACAGAYALNKKQGSFLVIDAGTCITYDFVNENNQYIGGAISPGLKMRASALNTFTEKLPLIKLDSGVISTIGRNTTDSIKSGISNGITHEINGYIHDICKKHNNIKVFLTGGDAFFFEDALKNGIFAEPNLVLIGINELMTFDA